MKFKVWNKKDKYWADETKFLLKSNGMFTSDPWFIPIFSTGKTDINGNELFTGDIRGANWWKYEICFGDYMIENDDCNTTYELTGFYIRYIDKSHGVNFFDAGNLSDQHLGNKFEHPELLKGN